MRLLNISINNSFDTKFHCYLPQSSISHAIAQVQAITKIPRILIAAEIKPIIVAAVDNWAFSQAAFLAQNKATIPNPKPKKCKNHTYIKLKMPMISPAIPNINAHIMG